MGKLYLCFFLLFVMQSLITGAHVAPLYPYPEAQFTSSVSRDIYIFVCVMLEMATEFVQNSLHTCSNEMLYMGTMYCNVFCN